MKTRRETVFNTLYQMGINEKDSRVLSRQIVQNLDNYADIHDLMTKRRNDEAMQKQSRAVVPNIAHGATNRTNAK